MSALQNIIQKLEKNQLEWAIMVCLEHGGEATAQSAAAELAALRERVAVSEKIMQDVKNYLDVVIKSQGGVGMEYELGLVEDIDIYFDKLQEAKQ